MQSGHTVFIYTIKVLLSKSVDLLYECIIPGYIVTVRLGGEMSSYHQGEK